MARLLHLFAAVGCASAATAPFDGVVSWLTPATLPPVGQPIVRWVSSAGGGGIADGQIDPLNASPPTVTLAPGVGLVATFASPGRQGLGNNLVVPAVNFPKPGQAYTVFYLSRLNASNVETAQRLLSDVGTNWLLGYWGPDLGVALEDKAYANFENGDAGWLTPNNVPATGKWRVYGIVVNAAGMGQAYRSATPIGQSKSALGPRVLRLGGGIGDQGAGPAEFGSGDIAEVIAWDRALTTTEVSFIAGYFCGKYGVCE